MDVAVPFEARRQRTPLLRSARWALAVVVVALLAALVAIGERPTGANSADGVVPPGARLAAQAEVGDAEVLLTVDAGRLVAMVAYDSGKGWLHVTLEPVAIETVAAWASTAGREAVPPLATVYGRAPGPEVRIDWSDGRSSTARTEGDGSYVVARPGQAHATRVVVLGESGQTVAEVTGL